jgi:hypothetical protein
MWIDFGKKAFAIACSNGYPSCGKDTDRIERARDVGGLADKDRFLASARDGTIH